MMLLACLLADHQYPRNLFGILKMERRILSTEWIFRGGSEFRVPGAGWPGIGLISDCEPDWMAKFWS